MTEVYLLNINEAEKIPLDYAKKHFPKRLEKAEKFIKKEDKLRSIAVGTLLYGVLETEEDKILLNDYNKPYCEENHVQFNLSHSGNYGVLCVGKCEVGIDVEVLTESRPSVIKRVFTKPEQRWIEQSADKSRAFSTLWTLKESVMKAVGKGFYLPPDTFDVMSIINGGSLRLEKRDLYGKTVFFENYALSVCKTEPIGELKIITRSAKDFI